jgi:hypothetical protein
VKFNELSPVPSSPDLAPTIVLTVSEAYAAFAPLESGSEPIEGATNFEIVSGDVATFPAGTGRLFVEWNALRRQLGIASRFNDPAVFLRDVAGHYGMPCVIFVPTGATHSIIVGRIENEPFALGIGYLKIKMPRLRTLRVVETGILCAPETAAAPYFVAKVLNDLLRSSAIDHLAINNLPADHPFGGCLDQFAEASSTSGFGFVREPRVHWRTQLLHPTTGERLVHHSSKTRYNLRRNSRKLDEFFGGKTELVRVERAEQVDAFVRDATAIIRQTYHAALGIGVKDTPAYRQFLTDTASDGCLCGYKLMAGDQAIAYLVGDVNEKTFRLWATSFLPQYGSLSPGIVLLARALDELAMQGVAVFDFGVGEADYKSMLGSERRHEYTWHVYSRSLRGRLAFLADRATGGLDALVRRLLRSGNLVQRVKKAWRNHIKVST